MKKDNNEEYSLHRLAIYNTQRNKIYHGYIPIKFLIEFVNLNIYYDTFLSFEVLIDNVLDIINHENILNNLYIIKKNLDKTHPDYNLNYKKISDIIRLYNNNNKQEEDIIVCELVKKCNIQ